MSNAWDEMRKAKEEEYFNRKNNEALNRLKSKENSEQPRRSPVSGEPMEKVVLHGVVVDRCKKSGGIWLEAGELEQILGIHDQQESEQRGKWLENFFRSLTNR